ncbi:MAG TPA: alpha/beta hydrolase [Caulobacteraceae bacterium]
MPHRPLAFTVSLAALTLASGCAQLSAPPPVATQTAPIHVDCRGAPTASPTVILEAGAFGTSADWDLVVNDLAKDGRACAYDRGGLGASAPRAGAEDPVSIARELAGVLDRLGETAPVILVGHSNGELYVEAFASLYPQRVAGVVYVNGVGVDDLNDPKLLGYLADERRLSDLAVTAASAGLAPLIASRLTEDEGLGDAAAERKRQALTCHPCLRVARDEDRQIVPGLTEVERLGGVPADIPTVVIVGATQPRRGSARAWRAAEVAPAHRAQRAWILDAVGATHVSPLARDRAYIDVAVDWLRSEAARSPRGP